jgi:hypothetical protein
MAATEPARGNYTALLPLASQSYEENRIREEAEWGPTVLRFFDYLTAVPVDRAFRILGLWTPDQTFEDFAATMVAKIPISWFSETHYAPVGPRLVFENSRLSLQQAQSPDLAPVILPFHTFSKPSQQILAAPGPPSKRRALNCFMAFRSK